MKRTLYSLSSATLSHLRVLALSLPSVIFSLPSVAAHQWVTFACACTFVWVRAPPTLLAKMSYFSHWIDGTHPTKNLKISHFFAFLKKYIYDAGSRFSVVNLEASLTFFSRDFRVGCVCLFLFTYMLPAALISLTFSFSLMSMSSSEWDTERQSLTLAFFPCLVFIYLLFLDFCLVKIRFFLLFNPFILCVSF